MRQRTRPRPASDGHAGRHADDRRDRRDRTDRTSSRARRAGDARRAAVRERIEAAADSTAGGIAAPAPSLVDALAREPAHPVVPQGADGDEGAGPVDPVDEALAELLVGATADAWQRGWQPADLHRAVERRGGRAAARLAARAAAHEGARHDPGTVPRRWRQQLDAIADDAPPAVPGAPRPRPWAVPWPAPHVGEPGVARVQAVAVAVVTLATVRALPLLPRLGPVPGERPAPVGWAGPPDASVLRKVTSLLAKAESTTFPDEAEALTAKAQQLMTRHAIDRAQLDAGRGAEPVAGGRRVPVDDPYARARFLVLAAVADANRCRTVWTSAWGFATVFGDEGDLDAVEMLYTSLLVQATRAMVLEPRPDAGSGGGTRSFRHAFLVAYAGRIGQRLAQADAQITAEVAESSTALVPLFTARREAADEALAAAFPETRRLRVSARNAAGWQAGVRAADRADLGLHRQVPTPGSRALR